MLTYEEMQYFAAFAQYGTLTEVAEKYTISQPTITRAMKKAEETFGVPLFNRTRNSIALNDNGRLAAEEIRLLLKQTDEMVDRVRSYDRASRTISIGTAAVIELPGLISRISRAFPQKAIVSEPGLPADLERGLTEDRYQLVILPYDLSSKKGKKGQTSEFYAKAIGEEHLLFYLPVHHRLARRKKLKLADMNGENMLLFSDIGFWSEIVHRKMPDSRFLMQNERYTFRELIENSVLPCFVTDLSLKGMKDITGRTAVQITDPEVNVTYYLTCRRNMLYQLQAVFA